MEAFMWYILLLWQIGWWLDNATDRASYSLCNLWQKWRKWYIQGNFQIHTWPVMNFRMHYF